MAWTKKQLSEATTAYERALRRAGRSPGTITTYVGDARRFIEWLDGSPILGRSRSVRSKKSAKPVLRVRGVGANGLIACPAELRKLVRAWAAAGRPAQVGIAWPRDRWLAAFPRHRAMLRSLPDELDRSGVRRVAAGSTASDVATEAAFIATMAWGYGWVGYGPHRTAKMLGSAPDALARLRLVALSAQEEGAAAAYGHLARDCRIKGLGPAFGTKFIVFCQPRDARPATLIHDELVSAWLKAHGRPDLVTIPWRLPAYEAYLEQVHAWADELAIEPEAVEYLIFQSMADERGNQWASPR